MIYNNTMNLITAVFSSVMTAFFFSIGADITSMGWFFAACGYFTLWNRVNKEKENKNDSADKQ